METQPQTAPTEVKEPVYKKGWRPAMAWAYVSIVIFDFMIAPIIMMVFFGQAQAPFTMPAGLTAAEYVELVKAMPAPTYHAWDPLTLKAGGFFHIAMGGVLGIGAWTRGVEKQKRVENGIHSN
jgi:ABC-type spermidine/putrescine transport system permease subunit II